MGPSTQHTDDNSAEGHLSVAQHANAQHADTLLVYSIGSSVYTCCFVFLCGVVVVLIVEIYCVIACKRILQSRNVCFLTRLKEANSEAVALVRTFFPVEVAQRPKASVQLSKQLSGAAMARRWSAYIHPRLVCGQVCGSCSRHRWEVWRTGQAGVFRKKLN